MKYGDITNNKEIQKYYDHVRAQPEYWMHSLPLYYT